MTTYSFLIWFFFVFRENIWWTAQSQNPYEVAFLVNYIAITFEANLLLEVNNTPYVWQTWQKGNDMRQMCDILWIWAIYYLLISKIKILIDW